MTFSLAKKLYDSGYRFYRAPERAYRGEQVVKLGGVLYLAPLLEELIKACGDYFAGLERVDDTHWVADYHENALPEDACKSVPGSSPVDSVGRLWFILNKTK